MCGIETWYHKITVRCVETLRTYEKGGHVIWYKVFLNFIHEHRDILKVSTI